MLDGKEGARYHETLPSASTVVVYHIKAQLYKVDQRIGAMNSA